MDIVKKIVIFGATSSIAEHCMRLWANQCNCHFFLVARNQEKLQRIKQDLEVRNPESKVSCMSLDFVSENEIVTVAKDIFLKNTIDIVLIAHGWLVSQETCQVDFGLLKESLLVNAVSPVLCAEVCVQYLEKSGYGTLAVIGSVAGDRGRKSNYVYGAAKGLLDRYIQGLQHRFAKSNIKVILIKPGPTDTAMTAHMHTIKLAPVQDVARDIVLGIQARKSVIYTPGKWKWIMLVIRFLPDFIFNKLPI